MISARILRTPEAYIREIAWRDEVVTITHDNRTGKTMLQRRAGEFIQIRPEDVQVIDHALDELSRTDESDPNFFAFINTLFEQTIALPSGHELDSSPVGP